MWLFEIHNRSHSGGAASRTNDNKARRSHRTPSLHRQSPRSLPTIPAFSSSGSRRVGEAFIRSSRPRLMPLRLRLPKKVAAMFSLLRGGLGSRRSIPAIRSIRRIRMRQYPMSPDARFGSDRGRRVTPASIRSMLATLLTRLRRLLMKRAGRASQASAGNRLDGRRSTRHTSSPRTMSRGRPLASRAGRAMRRGCGDLGGRTGSEAGWRRSP